MKKKNWKNRKFIFIAIGFLVVGMITTLTILLVDSQNNSSSKQSSKTKIDGTKLKTNSFKMSGSEARGTIELKDNVQLPEAAELRYSIGATTPTSDKKYTANKPTTLKNADVVYIKLFIKSGFFSTHKFPANFIASPIRFVVGGLQTLVSKDVLNANSFEVIGTEGKGKISKKANTKVPILPTEVEPRYYKGTSLPNNNNDYQKIPSFLLSNGDIVYIKFFIKDSFKITHKLPTSDFANPLRFEVQNLKSLIDVSKLNAKSFAFSKDGGQTKMQWRSSIELPNQIQIKHYVTNNRLKSNYKPSDNDYKIALPNSLQENAIIYVKFFIKDAFKQTYKFEDDFLDTITFQNIWPPYVKNANSFHDTIFEDSRGNIWLMSWREPLKVLVKNANGIYASSWTSDTSSGLLKGSKIINGYLGTIFEDSQGNLWAKGKSSKLQVLAWNDETKQYAESWSDDNSKGLLKGSNVIGGKHSGSSTIFEDSMGNLWTMGIGSPLQVLAKNDDGAYATAWTSDSTKERLLKGSKATSGSSIFFEDSLGNLWLFHRSKVQVLKRETEGNYASSWTSDTSKGLLKNLQLHEFFRIKIFFEDSNGNLWVVGRRMPIQVLKRKKDNTYASSWTSDTSKWLLKGLNIDINNNPFLSSATIFEDSKGNIWAMGHNSPLQVLIKNVDGTYADSWTEDTTSKLLNGSKIESGNGGIGSLIFEDYIGNLWAMRALSKIQILEKKSDGTYALAWTSDIKNKFLKGLKIQIRNGKKIFQDSYGNIWMTEYKGQIQIFDQKRQKWIRASEPADSS